jgi:hypothetical protein
MRSFKVQSCQLLENFLSTFPTSLQLILFFQAFVFRVSRAINFISSVTSYMSQDTSLAAMVWSLNLALIMIMDTKLISQ